MDLSIDFLKQVALDVYEVVNPLLGTREASKKLQRGVGGDISMHLDIVAENAIIESLEKRNVPLLLISEEIGNSSNSIIRPIYGIYY